MYHGTPLILKSGKFGKINRRLGEPKKILRGNNQRCTTESL
jgi:hypothetical protein